MENNQVLEFQLAFSMTVYRYQGAETKIHYHIYEAGIMDKKI